MVTRQVQQTVRSWSLHQGANQQRAQPGAHTAQAALQRCCQGSASRDRGPGAEFYWGYWSHEQRRGVRPARVRLVSIIGALKVCAYAKNHISNHVYTGLVETK